MTEPGKFVHGEFVQELLAYMRDPGGIPCEGCGTSVLFTDVVAVVGGRLIVAGAITALAQNRRGTS